MNGGGSATAITLGSRASDLTGDILLFSTFCAERFGGRGGRLEGLKAGAIIRPDSAEGLLEIDVLAVPLDRFENVEMFDMVEAIDSEESRRTMSGAEGLRGGRDGDDCMEGVRGGSLGGAVGFAGLEAS